MNPATNGKMNLKTTNNLVVGEIVINAADVFDLKNPKESRAIHRITNKISCKYQTQGYPSSITV